MSHSGHYERNAMFFRCLNNFRIPHRAARLDHRFCAGFGRFDHAVCKGIERIAGNERAFQRKPMPTGMFDGDSG